MVNYTQSTNPQSLIGMMGGGVIGRDEDINVIDKSCLKAYRLGDKTDVDLTQIPYGTILKFGINDTNDTRMTMMAFSVTPENSQSVYYRNYIPEQSMWSEWHKMSPNTIVLSQTLLPALVNVGDVEWSYIDNWYTLLYNAIQQDCQVILKLRNENSYFDYINLITTTLNGGASQAISCKATYESVRIRYTYDILVFESPLNVGDVEGGVANVRFELHERKELPTNFTLNGNTTLSLI